jgi:hypothetical protein
LLIQYFSAAISPTRGLFASLPCAIANEFTTLFSARTQRLPGFVAGTWSIQDACDSTDT